MHVKLEPLADAAIQFMVDHGRKEQLSQFLSALPPEWWKLAMRRGEEYEALVQNASAFRSQYDAICAEKVFSHDWFTDKFWIWHDLLAPYRTASAEVQVFELGVFEGRSIIFVAEYLQHSRVTALDHFILKKGWTSTQHITLQMDSDEAFHLNTKVYGDCIRTLIAPSWVGMTRLITESTKFDIVYIDASHTQADVLADTLLAWRMLKPGGLFIWDDFLLDIWDWDKNLVGKGVLAFLSMYSGKYEWLHAGWQVAVRKLGELDQ